MTNPLRPRKSVGVNLIAMRKSRCAIGLGGNLGDPIETLMQAIEGITSHPNCQLIAVSALYRSAAIGPAGQPDYANAALVIDTTLEPHSLLDLLQSLEQKAGRVRDIRWGARTLDLDILLIDDMVIQDERLTVPHAELWNRAFVLRPLRDLQKETTWPTQINIVSALEDPMIRSQDISLWLDPRWQAGFAPLRRL